MFLVWPRSRSSLVLTPLSSKRWALKAKQTHSIRLSIMHGCSHYFPHAKGTSQSHKNRTFMGWKTTSHKFVHGLVFLIDWKSCEVIISFLAEYLQIAHWSQKPDDFCIDGHFCHWKVLIKVHSSVCRQAPKSNLRVFVFWQGQWSSSICTSTMADISASTYSCRLFTSFWCQRKDDAKMLSSVCVFFLLHFLFVENAKSILHQIIRGDK